MKKTLIGAGLALSLLALPATNALAGEKLLEERCQEIVYALEHQLVDSRASLDEYDSGSNLMMHIIDYKNRLLVQLHHGTYDNHFLTLIDKGSNGTVDDVYRYDSEEKLDKFVAFWFYKNAIDYFWKSKNIEERVKLHRQYKYYNKLLEEQNEQK